MNIPKIFPGGINFRRASCRPTRGLVAMLIALVVFGGSTGTGLAQPSDPDESGAQALTRGPVHEAFAGIVSYDPEPGIVVTNAPPEPIEEVPPEERPEGNNVAWIPGYWAWDDERSDFLWISGTWRALPPDREWRAGYWAQTSQGHQWISGYWADATANETTYLPPPPQNVEAGPNVEAPSADYTWTPGCWLWIHGRYAWRPGYWTEGRADWDWIPAHYVWTPRGYIFVEGYWDYSVERRGILFAPVYFESRVYSRRGYHYSPTIVISVGAFTDHLFLRPRYSHYYFGDYYAPSYQQSGFYASFTFQSGRHGYDPFYAHQRWAHRADREWDRRIAASYQYRRDHEAARPPRTWAAQRRIDSRTAEFTQNRLEVAVSIDQLTKRKDGPMRFQPVARKERQQLVQRNQEVQKSREQRRTLEAKGDQLSAPRPGVRPAPTKVQQPRSPIVAKPASKLEKNQAPPKTPRAPKPDSTLQPQTGSPVKASPPDRDKPGARSRSSGSDKKFAPDRNVAAPDSRAVSPVPTERTNNAAGKADEKSPRKAKEPERKTRQESDQRTKEPAVKTRGQAPQNTRDMEQKKAEEAAEAAKVSAIRAREESLRRTQEAEQRAQRELVQSDKKAPAPEQRRKDTKPPRKKERTEEKKKARPAEEAPTP